MAIRPVKKFVKNAKAISPLIATLLLIAIAVAASVITYSWVMSMIGSQSQQAQTQVRVDVVQWTIGAGSVKNVTSLTVRNTGSVSATIESVSITKDGVTIIATLANKIAIATGTTQPYSFKAGTDGVLGSWTWLPSSPYTIRVTTTTGFYYELTSASPAS